MSARVAGADSNGGGLSSETGGRESDRAGPGRRQREKERWTGVRRRRGSHGRVQCGAGPDTYDTPVFGRWWRAGRVLGVVVVVVVGGGGVSSVSHRPDR